ncbi:TKL protein kinase [Saprolegnia diclina VS20]|uniref:TKL protein kinase n=1 Tax=Saprolegnia diclina (strain VS20) TaxID=1156394 RepID=T0Q8J7_SAPDV|nr:TKL protein kinase [Saprolegnia diclina VS20]EQC29800.1 TKL protein kinase [Saprolegnia diclina VS20]|eukprot:XP_008616639.1 TKL protein kinase [Saprolegnia diclina VS20]
MAACNDTLAAFWVDRRACLLSGKPATNASTYCAEPACVRQLTSLQVALQNQCSGVADADIPKVLGARLTPSFCLPACVDVFNTLQASQAACTRSGTKTVSQCSACTTYKLTVPKLLQGCQFNASSANLLTAIAGDSSECETSVANASVDGTAASSAIYWVLGVLVTCIVIGMCVYRHLKRTNVVKKDLNYYRKQGSQPKKKLPSNLQNLFLDNDVRLDPNMVDYIFEQDQLSQITLKSKGGFGLVFSAYLQTSDGPIRVALKQLLPEKTSDIDQLECFMSEIRLAARLDHANIVRFVGIAWSSLQDLSMMTEFMARGDLHRLLRHELKQPAGMRTLAWTSENRCNKLSIAANVIDALVYLHSLSIIHRDLKAKNVLLTEDFTAQVTDFGVSRESDEDGDAIMTARVGTSAWIAPEILRGELYTVQADLYSFGVLLAELDTLQTPYSNPDLQPEITGLSSSQLASKVAQGKIQPAFTNDVPHALHQIAQRCLQYKYTKRPTASQISMEIHALLLKDNARLSGRCPV